VYDEITAAAFSRYAHLGDLDVVLSVPWRRGSRESLAPYADDAAGSF